MFMGCWNVGRELVCLAPAWGRWLYKCARTTAFNSLCLRTEGSGSASRSPTVTGLE